MTRPRPRRQPYTASVRLSARIACLRPEPLQHRLAAARGRRCGRRCAERGIAFVPFFAIAGGGRDDGRRAGELEPVLAVARAHRATPAQVRLAWTLAQGDHVLAIPGTSSLAHLTENVAAGALRLTDEELALLSGLRQPG
jgi:pyridoxine 4-dehydrogenase